MPKLPKYIEKICFHCGFYQLTENGAYCNSWHKIFPDRFGWVTDKSKKKPGERTCPRWTEK